MGLPPALGRKRHFEDNPHSPTDASLKKRRAVHQATLLVRSASQVSDCAGRETLQDPMDDGQKLPCRRFTVVVYVSNRTANAVSTNVRGVDVESGALSARTQDEGAVGTAARTRTPRAASLADRTAQRLVVAALASFLLRYGKYVVSTNHSKQPEIGRRVPNWRTLVGPASTCGASFGRIPRGEQYEQFPCHRHRARPDRSHR